MKSGAMGAALAAIVSVCALMGQAEAARVSVSAEGEYNNGEYYFNGKFDTTSGLGKYTLDYYRLYDDPTESHASQNVTGSALSFFNMDGSPCSLGLSCYSGVLTSDYARVEFSQLFGSFNPDRVATADGFFGVSDGTLNISLVPLPRTVALFGLAIFALGASDALRRRSMPRAAGSR